jgi:tetratricopeptide (TPR) repeat protein
MNPCRHVLLCTVPSILFLASSVCAVTKMAVFPLVNTGGDRNREWASSVVPEGFSRLSQYCQDLQVLSPAFLFPADSLGWTMSSDSLLKIHWLRWDWNVACGGSYSVSQGRITCDLRVLFLRDGKPQKRSIILSASLDSADALVADLFSRAVSCFGKSLSRQEEQFLRKPLSRSIAARMTYCAAYGFEMRNNAAAALSAYSRCCELDPSFAFAFCRIARLYRVCGSTARAASMFSRSVSLSSGDPAIVSAAADFYVRTESASHALDFIKKHRSALELTAEGMTAIGTSLLLSGELQRAISMLTRAVAKGPPDLETDFILGRAYMTSGDFAKATDVFNRLVKYQPECPRYYALLGAAYRSNGRIMESLRILEQSNATNPGNVPLQVNLAQTYFDLGWYDKAELILLDALRKNPGITDLYVDLGVLFWHTGKRKEAGEYFDKASRMGKNVQSAINNEANILVLTGDAGKAIGLYKRADRVGGKNEAILTNLARAYLEKGRLADAASCFDAVLALTPDRLDVLEQSASIASKRGKTPDAINFYRRILDVSPHNKNALTNITGILVAQKQYKEAVDPVEAYLIDFPLDKQFLVLCAELYRLMGWYEVAASKYEAIIKDFPDNAAGYLGLGKSMFDLIQYKNSRNYDKTIFYLKAAAERDRTDPEPDYLMGMIYRDYKNYGELALDSFKSALSKATDPEMKKTLRDLVGKAEK